MEKCIVVFSLLLFLCCNLTYLAAQAPPEVDNEKVEIKVNERLIKMYNQYMESGETPVTFEEIVQNYTVDEAKSIFQAYQANKLDEFRKVKVEEFLAEQKKAKKPLRKKTEKRSVVI